MVRGIFLNFFKNSLEYSNLTGLTYKLGHPYYSGILHYTPGSIDAWNVDAAHPLALEQGVYIGVIKIAVNNRDSGHYLDFHMQDVSGSVLLWEMEGLLPMSVPGGTNSYRTGHFPFIYSTPVGGITLYPAVWESVSISEVIYEVSFVKVV